MSDLGDTRDLDGVADATKEKRMVHFDICPPPLPPQDDVQDAGVSDLYDDESSTEGESCGGDTAASSTDDDIARGCLTAVAARRKDKAQPEKRVVGDMHPYRQPADRNMMPDVGNVALMIGN